MKCPFCGGEMTPGYVRSARTIFFSKEDGGNALLCRPSRQDVVLSMDNWTGPICIAYRCGECKKVMIEEPKKQKRFFET